MNNKNNKNNFEPIIFLGVLLLIFSVFSLMYYFNDTSSDRISYNEFVKMIENKKIKTVIFDEENVKIESKDGKIYYTGIIRNDINITQKLLENNVDFQYKPKDKSVSMMFYIINNLLPIVFILGLFYMTYKTMKGSGGIMGVGKSSKFIVETNTGITFKNVAGQDEAKETLQEMVDFLHNPLKYTAIGAKLPRGALLVGPPGTGKTLIAKAVAGEANVPFFFASGSDFVEMFVGMGASRIRSLFKEAKEKAPCIIFIDEIDAVGKKRDSRNSNDEHEHTLNQLLSEMDGFDSNNGIIVLGATNRPEILDKALLRPGRFDRRVIVEKPDLQGRIDILKVHSKNIKLSDDVDFKEVALQTAGTVGADLANIVNESAINAVKNNRIAVTQKDMIDSIEVVLVGKEKKDRILSYKERMVVAYHEIGHALVSTVLKGTDPVQKITIIPRTGGALGYVMHVPEDEKYLESKDDMLNEILTLCGGRAAETVVFDSVTSGASNDLEKATNIARSMVTLYGMSDELGFIALEDITDRYLGGGVVRNCSDITSEKIDIAVKNILNNALEKAIEIIKNNRKIMDEAAKFLNEHETITGKQFMEIYNRMKDEDGLDIYVEPYSLHELELKSKKDKELLNKEKESVELEATKENSVIESEIDILVTDETEIENN